MKQLSLNKCFVLLVLCLCCCCQGEQQRLEVKVYPTMKKIAEEAVQIALADYERYGELTKVVSRLNCMDSIVTISFRPPNCYKVIEPVNNCDIEKWNPSPSDIIRFKFGGKVLKNNLTI